MNMKKSKTKKSVFTLSTKIKTYSIVNIKRLHIFSTSVNKWISPPLRRHYNITYKVLNTTSHILEDNVWILRSQKYKHLIIDKLFFACLCDIPVHYASSILGVSETFMKKHRHILGIKKWPHPYLTYYECSIIQEKRNQLLTSFTNMLSSPFFQDREMNEKDSIQNSIDILIKVNHVSEFSNKTLQFLATREKKKCSYGEKQSFYMNLFFNINTLVPTGPITLNTHKISKQFNSDFPVVDKNKGKMYEKEEIIYSDDTINELDDSDTVIAQWEEFIQNTSEN